MNKNVCYPEVGVSREVNLCRLDVFAEFESDWNGYNADPMNGRAIAKTRELIECATIQPEIFPIPDGSVQCEWETPEVYIEVHITKKHKWKLAWQPADCDEFVSIMVKDNPKKVIQAVDHILSQHGQI